MAKKTKPQDSLTLETILLELPILRGTKANESVTLTVDLGRERLATFNALGNGLVQAGVTFKRGSRAGLPIRTGRPFRTEVLHYLLEQIEDALAGEAQ